MSSEYDDKLSVSFRKKATSPSLFKYSDMTVSKFLELLNKTSLQAEQLWIRLNLPSSKQNKQIELLQKLEELTGVPKLVFILGGSSALVLATKWIFRIAFSLVCDLTGVAYPVVKTLDLLENESKHRKKEEKNHEELDETRREEIVQWGTYWMIFAACKLTDYLRKLIPLQRTLVNTSINIFFFK